MLAVALSVGIAATTLELDFPSRTAANGAPASAMNPHPEERAICARGRFEPKDGIVKVAGPSQTAIFSNVISELRIKEGDRVEAGQIIAVFDSYSSKQAAVERLRAELAHAQREYQRFHKLFHDGVTSAEEREDWQTRVEVTKAKLVLGRQAIWRRLALPSSIACVVLSLYVSRCPPFPAIKAILPSGFQLAARRFSAPRTCTLL